MYRRHRGPWRAILAGTAVLLAAGCTPEGVKPDEKPGMLSGYTCCNFHYEKDWINDGNYAQLPMIPAGSPIKVTDYGRYRAHVDINGQPFRLGLDYGRDAETTEQWVAKLIVAIDPKAKLASYPAAVRQAIQKGQIMVGMTKEQVIMAVGYPLTNENPRLDAPFWRYWWSSFGEYQVHWSGDRVSQVTGDPATVTLMVASGTAAGTSAPTASAQAAPENAATPTAAPSAKKPGGKSQGGKTRGKSGTSSGGN
jgi:hypothetical protein